MTFHHRVIVIGVLLATIADAGAARAEPGATAPTATITTTPALAGATEITFDEDVRSVSSGSVVLRVKGTTSDVPATLTCRDANAAPSPCDAGPVRTVSLRPQAPLVAGQVYSVKVNPEGASAPVSDATGTPAATTTKNFRASLTEQENSAGATFLWRNVSSSAAAGGSYRTEHVNGASAALRFAGTSVAWITRTGPSEGKATISIDGAVIEVVNNYASGVTEQVPRRYSGLQEGSHRIAVFVRGEKGARAGRGTWVAVDGFQVGDAPVPETDVTYRWDTVSSSSASAGRYVRTDTAGARVSFSFRGKGIDWYTIEGPGMGKARVYVDDVLRATVDNYASSTRFGVRRSLAGLSDRVHALSIVVLGTKRAASSGAFVAVDKWVVRLPSIASFKRLGQWVDLYDYTSYNPTTKTFACDRGLDPATAVADLANHGVKTLYIQTSRYTVPDDLVCTTKLATWVEQAHASGLKIVGWYLPGYADMARDVRRTVAIATFRTPGGQRFDALAIDIEDKNEVDHDRDRFNDGIKAHLARTRGGVGNSYPVGAIFPAPLGMALRPSSWEGFPWDFIGRYSDVVLPMNYWSYRKRPGQCPDDPSYCAYEYTRGNIARSKRNTGLPVHVIGGVGNAIETSEAGEVDDFARAAIDGSAYGGSFYDYRTTKAAFWRGLEKLNQL